MFFANFYSIGQIKGVIKDSVGNRLAFANILIKGTSFGTTSNSEGIFSLSWEDKFPVEIEISFVGFKPKKITISSKNQYSTVILEEDLNLLQELVIYANREDPAYAVIRKAIQKRKYYRDQANEYEANVYIKGQIKILTAPKKIFGKEVGDLSGNLDSARKGIVYLSESESIYKRAGKDKIKEIMVSSKVSGNDNGFSFNQASTLDYNIYDNYLEFRRQMLSPIATDALLFYRYKMLGTWVDENNKTIHKIQVIPKRNEDPVFAGVINIEDDTWAVRNFNLYMTDEASKISSFDTLRLIQQYTFLDKENIWRLFSTRVEFNAKLFGFEVAGSFVGLFNNYKINPNFPPGTFDNEILKVEPNANKKDSAYWIQHRPIELTEEESIDYVRKDSIKTIRESKEYMDSTDRKNNQFKLLDLLNGYNVRNSYQGYQYNFKIFPLHFNPVQGLHIGLKTEIQHRKINQRISWQLSPSLSYGFSDQNWRYSLSGSIRFNRIDRSRLSISLGDQVVDQNSRTNNAMVLNSYWSLFQMKNILKLYEKKYFTIDYRRELTNGLNARIHYTYSDRKGLSNHTQFSFVTDKGDYKSNTVGSDDLEIPSSLTSIINKVGFSLSYTPASKFLSYPDVKVNLGSKYPTFDLKFENALIGWSKTAYQKLEFGIEDEEVKLGLFGTLGYKITLGRFSNTSLQQFPDFQHLSGHLFWLIRKPERIDHFKLLPYYDYFAKNQYIEFYTEYSDNGYILDKIPVLRKLGFFTVGSFKLANMDRTNTYMEWAVGLDRVGWGKFRLFRIDVVHAFKEMRFWKSGVVLSVQPAFGN